MVKVRVKQEGLSLVVVMVFIAILSALAITAVKMGGLTALSMYDETKAKKAYYIAEAAYQHALFMLNQDSEWRDELIDQAFDGGVYSLNVSQASSIDDITLTASGSISGTERTIVRVIPAISVKPFIIVAFAGTGDRGRSGNNGPAVDAELDSPRGMSKNIAGDVYIADTDNHQIRYVDAVSKNIYRFAGWSSDSWGGYNCNDCDPLTARLDEPRGVYIDSAGNVYIADRDNHIVRKVIAGGNIINIAGIPEWSGYSGDGGLATSARLNRPRDVAVDGDGNIYIADSRNCRIRRVDAATAVITTFAGTGSCGFGGDGGAATNARFDDPRGLAFDTAGNLYVADTDNHRIRKIDMGTTIVTTVAGTSAGFAGDGGLAVDARLDEPEGVAINQFGTIYIADTDNHRIRKIDPSTGIITTYAGTGSRGDSGDDGPPTDAELDRPRKVIAYDDVEGHILIADTGNNRIREVTNAY